MIHDILLALLAPNNDKLPIVDFMVSIKCGLYTEILITWHGPSIRIQLSESSHLIHPGEYNILKNIIEIGNYHKDIKNFTRQYQFQSTGIEAKLNLLIRDDVITEGENLHGLYLQALCEGIEISLKEYYNAILELEERYLKKPNFSLIFIYQQLVMYEPMLRFHLYLINEIKSQKLHGCAILYYLHQNSTQVGDLLKTINIIIKHVYNVFLQQLSQWLLFGKVIDKHTEFFIQKSDTMPSLSDKMSAATTALSDTTSINYEMWKYDICFEMLPNQFPLSWAEKVLFIGQTVLMFNSAPKENDTNVDTWLYDECDSNSNVKKKSIFDTEEDSFIQRFNNFYVADEITPPQIEQIVDNIKNCVTKNLSDIAINEADLLAQLKLIKNYFLLGRGDLFLEFTKRIEPIMKNEITDITVREINKAFEAACNAVHASDKTTFITNLFKFHVKRDLDESYDYENKGFLNYITLKYKVEWPLNLIFTPKVLERYNEMFQFLIKIRMIQYQLNMVWSYHREHKMEKNSRFVILRNKLVFLIENLQYYLQVDVLESQFCILMDTINNTKDFEIIQRAHSLFQVNILSLCFLINANQTTGGAGVDKFKSLSDKTICVRENPVYDILNEILHLTDLFCMYCLNKSDAHDADSIIQIEEFDNTFAQLIDSLIKIFIGLKAGPCNTPLTQLLLRLDFNYWFSSQIEKNKKQIVL